MTYQPCVVVPAGAEPWWKNADLEYETCGAPAVGHRAGFPMCSFHMDIFDPERDDDDWIFVDNEIKRTETIVDPEGRI